MICLSNMRTQLYILGWELKVFWELIKLKLVLLINSPLISEKIYKRQEIIRRMNHSVVLLNEIQVHFSDLQTFENVRQMTYHEELVLNEFHEKFVRELKKTNSSKILWSDVETS